MLVEQAWPQSSYFTILILKLQKYPEGSTKWENRKCFAIFFYFLLFYFFSINVLSMIIEKCICTKQNNQLHFYPSTFHPSEIHEGDKGALQPGLGVIWLHKGITWNQIQGTKDKDSIQKHHICRYVFHLDMWLQCIRVDRQSEVHMSLHSLVHLPFTATFGEVHQVKFKKVRTANHSKATFA